MRVFPLALAMPSSHSFPGMDFEAVERSSPTRSPPPNPANVRIDPEAQYASYYLGTTSNEQVSGLVKQRHLLQAISQVRQDMEGSFVVHRTFATQDRPSKLILTSVLYGEIVQREILNTPVSLLVRLLPRLGHQRSFAQRGVRLADSMLYAPTLSKLIEALSQDNDEV